MTNVLMGFALGVAVTGALMIVLLFRWAHEDAVADEAALREAWRQGKVRSMWPSEETAAFYAERRAEQVTQHRGARRKNDHN